jgi:hypothetical protein
MDGDIDGDTDGDMDENTVGVWTQTWNIPKSLCIFMQIDLIPCGNLFREVFVSCGPYLTLLVYVFLTVFFHKYKEIF